MQVTTPGRTGKGKIEMSAVLNPTESCTGPSRRFYDSTDENRWGRTSIPDLERAVEQWLSLGGVAEGSVVVELGCGRGAFTYLSERFRYFGIDLSFEALSRYVGPPAAVQADVGRLPLASECADFVFSIATLEHVPNPENVLAEVDRILKPGGSALLSPAWFCRPWAARGLPIKTYSELEWRDKVRKALIPLRNSLIWRSAFAIPRRLRRELCHWLAPARWRFQYQRLSPNLEEYIYTDCDAFCSLDPHEAVMLFRHWRYQVPSAPGFWRRVLLRNVPVAVQKPSALKPGITRESLSPKPK